MPHYIQDLVPKTTHVGNSLSSFNLSFSALDDNLFELSSFALMTYDNLLELSSYTISELTAIQSDINSISSDVYPSLYTASYNSVTSATFYIDNGNLQTITLTGDTMLMAPLGDALPGNQLKIYLNSGTGGHDFSFDPTIIIPSESTFSSPYTLLSANHLWITQLEYLGSDWALTTLVGGYNI